MRNLMFIMISVMIGLGWYNTTKRMNNTQVVASIKCEKIAGVIVCSDSEAGTTTIISKDKLVIV